MTNVQEILEKVRSARQRLPVNEAAVRFYGYSRDEFPALTVDDVAATA